jgi:hypothetical protein
MNETEFYHTITEKAKAYQINPLLVLSGIEGLYTFRNVALNAINFEFLDSLILTIFSLRIGDQFHSLAEEQMKSTNLAVSEAAIRELSELSPEQITAIGSPYMQAFARVLNGKSPVRRYHIKALEVAAHEIQKTQERFGADSISTVMLVISKEDLNNSLGLAELFQ